VASFASAAIKGIAITAARMPKAGRQPRQRDESAEAARRIVSINALTSREK